MRTVLCLAFVVLDLGCKPQRLVHEEGGLSTEPAALDFGRVWVGQPASRTFLLRSTSAVPRQARLLTEPPFSVESQTQVSPGEARSVEVTALASATGPLTGTLHVLTDQGELQIALIARAEAVPPCSARTCQRARFDTDAGACLVEPLDDGEPCASACIASGRCLHGACAGTVLSCDDGDACTSDACDSTGACIHLPVTCPTPTDPCQVARCDSSQGCLSSPADDGTACGQSDCTTSQVCLAGACVTAPTAEGAPCGEVSVCRSLGHCQAGACEQGPAQLMTPLWTYRPPQGDSLNLINALDDAGNLYWLEPPPRSSAAPGTTAQLVSATLDGLVRYRVEIARAGNTVAFQRGLLIMGGFGWVDAYRTADGSLAWHVEPPDIPGAAALGVDTAWVSDLVADGWGNLSFLLSGNKLDEQRYPTLVIGVDLATGQVRWSRSLWDASAMAGDGQGRVFAYGRAGGPPPNPPRLFALDSLTGQELWRREQPNPLQAAHPNARIAVFDSLVFTSADGYDGGVMAVTLDEAQALDGSTGPLGAVFQAGDWMPDLRGTAGHGWIVSQFGGSGTAGNQPNLLSVDTGGGGATSWSSLASWVWGDLSSRHSLIRVDPSEWAILHEFDLSSFQLHDCQLDTRTLDPVLVDRVRLVLSFGPVNQPTEGFSVYAMPSVDSPKQGWVAERGNLQRTGTPR